MIFMIYCFQSPFCVTGHCMYGPFNGRAMAEHLLLCQMRRHGVWTIINKLWQTTWILPI